MILIVIAVNYKSCCFWPFIPVTLCSNVFKQSTTFINANIVRAWFFCGVNLVYKSQNVWFRLRLCKFCPCLNNTTWVTDCFNTVKSSRAKIMFWFFLTFAGGWSWVEIHIYLLDSILDFLADGLTFFLTLLNFQLSDQACIFSKLLDDLYRPWYLEPMSLYNF